VKQHDQIHRFVPAVASPQQRQASIIHTVGGGTVLLSGTHYEVRADSSAGAIARLRSTRPFSGRRWTLIEHRLRHSDAGQVAQTRRWGSFDSTEGVFFELVGTELYAVLRIGGVDTRVSRAGWNLKRDAIDIARVHVWGVRADWTSAVLYVDGVAVHSFALANDAVTYQVPTHWTWAIEIENTDLSVAGGVDAYAVDVSVDAAAEGLRFAASIPVSTAALNARAALRARTDVRKGYAIPRELFFDIPVGSGNLRVEALWCHDDTTSYANSDAPTGAFCVLRGDTGVQTVDGVSLLEEQLEGEDGIQRIEVDGAVISGVAWPAAAQQALALKIVGAGDVSNIRAGIVWEEF
jgi:hypothetical protein